MTDDPKSSPERQPPPPANAGPDEPAAERVPASARRTIKIGSQRDADKGGQRPATGPGQQVAPSAPVAPDSAVSKPTVPDSVAPDSAVLETEVAGLDASEDRMLGDAEQQLQQFAGGSARKPGAIQPEKARRIEVPGMTDELEAELDAALGDVSLDALLEQPASITLGAMGDEVELDTRYQARVIKADDENVFFQLTDRAEGVASRRQMPEPPEPGTTMEVVPVRYVRDDNLYEVVVPGGSVDVQDWSDLSEGVVVEARITGHNKGGLECEVNQIRGFIPASQVSLFRVEDFEAYVGQTLPCVVTEANEQRGNLVLSHRAVLERERAASREKLLEELEVGQVREGIVTRLQNFGAFVDLGGIDGLIHISQLSWDRVAHPSDVLEEGQKVRVRVDKVDPVTGKIGLSYRDLLEDPWEEVEQQFPSGTIVEGTVTKLADFGAFVRLGPGVEGLVHVSELAHHRVQRVNSVVREGETVLVKVLSVDKESQRMSLSIKQAKGPAEGQGASGPEAGNQSSEQLEAEPERVRSKKPSGPLKGGLGGPSSDGDRFGLKW